MTAWLGSDRVKRLPSNWSSLRSQAMRRASGRCEWVHGSERCSSPAIEVDHIERGDDHRLDNLQALCKQHHATKTGREGQQAMQAKRESLKAHFLRQPETRF